MRSTAAAADVIDLSSDDDDEVPVPSTSAAAAAAARRVAPSTSPRDVTPYALVDVKPALLYPLQPPGVVVGGSGALVPVKEELPLLTPVPLLAAGYSPSTPSTKVALPAPRLCRQFWKSGDYVVAQRNPDADAPGKLRLAKHLGFSHFASLLSFPFGFWWRQV